MRSSGGSWGCLTWRKGASGNTLSLSAIVLKEAVMSVFSQETGQEEMASSCARDGLDWTVGKITSLKVWSTLEQSAQGIG